MSSYQAVPLGAAEGGKSLKPTVFTIHVEKIRFIAYCAFWGFVIFAFIVSKLLVWPNMKCEEGTGMDCADLIAAFGTNNPCIYWDYDPATQLTALVYPIFEFSLVLYLLMSHLQIKNDMLNGVFPADKEKLMNFLFWMKVVLVAWFRMIFVCKVTDDALIIGSLTINALTAHTIGFLGLQVGLVFVAFENVLYLTYRKQSFWCFSNATTVKLSYTYLVLLTIFTVIKMTWTIQALSTGEPNSMIPFSVSEFTNKAWMLFAAVLPIFFALEQMKKDPPMIVTLVNTDARK